MMKNPHLTFVCLFVSMTALIACDKSAIEEAVPLSGDSIEPRCCDELGDNPLFNEVWDDIRIGLLEPTQDIIEAMDPDYLEFLLFQFDKCIAQDEYQIACVDELLGLLNVKTYLDNVNSELFDSLRIQYEHLTDEEFQRQFIDAAINTSNSDTRDLPCYTEFESKMIKALTDVMMPTLDPYYPIRRIRDILEAYNDFCNCIYNKYGSKCW